MTALAARAVLAVLTLIYALVAMASCSVVAPPVEAGLAVEGIAQEQPARTLRILSARGEESYALQQAVDRFSAARPDVTVQLQTIGEESDYRAALRTRLIGSELEVDLFHIYGRREMLELQPWLRDLSGLDWAGAARGGVLDAVCLDDAVYGVPHSLEGFGLLVNQDIFAAAGLDPNGMQNLESFDETLGALRELIEAGELVEEWPDLEAAAAFSALNASAGEQLADLLLGGEFDSAEAAAAAGSVSLDAADRVGEYIDIMARHAAAGRGWSRLGDTAEAAAVDALAAGRVAVIQGGSAAWAEIARRDPDLAARLLLLPIPLSSEEEEDGTVYLEAPVYWAVNVRADPESAALAEEFLTWLYTGEEGADLLAGTFAALSPYEEEARTDAALHSQLLGYLRAGRTAPRLHREAPAGWTGAAHEQLRAYFGELDKTWESVADTLRERWLELRLAG